MASLSTFSASGKIILFGEHAVVYGRPALAVPVTQVHADVEVRDYARAGIWIEAPDINLHAELNSLPSDHPIASVIHNFLFLSRVSPSYPRAERSASEDEPGISVKAEGKFPNLEIHITSTIPVASGLGSGAAVTVALVRALSAHLSHPMTEEAVNAFAYEIEKLYHGTPSGIDNTVVTYGKPVYFTKGKPIEVFKVGKPFRIVIGDTGIPAPTKESVADVRRLWTENTQRFEVIFDEIADISFAARRAIEAGQVDKLGTLMNENHACLQEMTVSSPELDQLVSAARTAGASGAKLSGGGRGGNMIALVEDNGAQNIAEALRSAGAKRTIITKVA